MLRGTVVEGELVAVMVNAAPSFGSIPTGSCPDSKLQEELQALRKTFSNFTVSTEAEVKALSVQGEEGWGWGWEAAEGWRRWDTEQVSPPGGGVGRKMKSLESQLEKQQQELSEGQRGSMRMCASVCVCRIQRVLQAKPRGLAAGASVIDLGAPARR